MHLKNLPLLLLALCPFAAIAQPTLTAANFNPVITDAFAIKVCNSSPALPGAGAAATTWDFTDLVTTGNDTGMVHTCPSSASTAHCSLFPGSNIYMKGFGLNYQTAYYNDNTSGQAVYGYYSAPDTNIVLTDPADQFRFPFSYGASYSDPYSGIITVGALSGHVGGVISVDCDGYGTLKLPGRTDDNVLRVHTTQTFNDSVYIISPSPVVIVYTIETYSWYKADYHAPLLTYATIKQGSTLITNFTAYAPAQVNYVTPLASTALETLALYPNPAQGELNIDFTVTNAEPIRITLLDMTGRETAVLADKTTWGGKQHFSYNTLHLSKGLYMARIQSGAETIIRKVEIQ